MCNCVLFLFIFYTFRFAVKEDSILTEIDLFFRFVEWFSDETFSSSALKPLDGQFDSTFFFVKSTTTSSIGLLESTSTAITTPFLAGLVCPYLEVAVEALVDVLLSFFLRILASAVSFSLCPDAFD